MTGCPECSRPPRCREVTSCWRPGCALHCRFFDRECLMGDVRPADPLFVLARGCGSRPVGRKTHFHRPGECYSCAGTGLGTPPGPALCMRCRGTGICPCCAGMTKVPKGAAL